MLNNDINIIKFRYEKENQTLFVEMSAKRYIFFREESELIKEIRSMYNLGKEFTKIVFDFIKVTVDKEKTDEYIKDIYENLFNEFNYFILYKSTMNYEVKNDIVRIYIPQEASKIADMSKINANLSTYSKRLGNAVRFIISETINEDATKIRDASVAGIRNEKPDVIVLPPKEEEIEQPSGRKITRICELDSNSYKVVIEGTITYVKIHKNQGYQLFEFGVNDLSGSIVCKKFFSREKDKDTIDKYENIIVENKYVNVSGRHQIEKNSPRYFINADKVTEVRLGVRTDKARVKRTEMNIDTDHVNADMLLEQLNRWKHKAFGIMPKDNIYSFVDIYNKNFANRQKLKMILGVTLKVLMDDNTAIFNPDKTEISRSICVGYIKEDNFFVHEISDRSVKRSEVLKKNDYIGIRNFCENKAIYIFSEADDDYVSSMLAKNGITVINVKKLFEILENKTYTVSTLLLRLNASSDNIASAAYAVAVILKKSFDTYEEICIKIADNNVKNDNLNVYPVSVSVMNREGLRNLYRILTKRNCIWNIVPKSYLEAHRYGLLLGSSDTDGELYSMLINDAATETVYAKTIFYDYINLMTDRHAELLKEKNTIKTINEFRNFNKFLYKCAVECNVIAIATCFSKDISKSEFMTTNEMLSEFSYLDKDNANKVVIENTAYLSEQAKFVSPVTEADYKDDIISIAYLTNLNDKSEAYEKEFKLITKEKTAEIIILIGKMIEKLKDKDILFRPESVPTPYILSRMFNDDSYNYLQKNDFKIHVQKDAYDEVYDILKEICINHRPFSVKYDKYTAVHLLPSGYSIYDFSPMVMRNNDMVTLYGNEILREYFSTFILQPDEDLQMIKHLVKLTNIYPSDNLIETVTYDNITFITPDSKTHDVLNMIKPASGMEFVRCIGLIYGQGCWYDNAERLIHERLSDIYDVICFKHELDDEKKDDEMHKESKRKIRYCITYEEALIHSKNMMILKWYLDNYPKQFKLEYINRYRDLDKFENQFKINKADISNSLKNRYLHDEELTAITEPLDVISYLDEKMIDNIILNRPYSSVEDFALKNRMDSELLNKLKTDGYLDSLAKTDQLAISDVF